MMSESIQPAIGDKSTLRSTARNIAWNYAGYAYQIAINFGLTSYVVRRVSIAEYGLFMFVLSLSGTLYLLDMGIANVLVQAYVEAIASTDKDRLSNIMSTVFVALSALGALGVLAFSGLALSLPGPFNISHQYLHEASLIFVIAALVIQVGLPCTALEHVYQASHRFDRINQIQLATSTVQMILSAVLLATGHGIVSLALVQLVGALLRTLFLIFGLRGAVPRARLNLARFNWALLKPLLNLSKWAFLNNLCTCLFDALAWIILGSLGSMTEAAMYGVANKAPRQLWNLVDKGANVSLPQLSQSFTENDEVALQQTYLRTQKLVFGAVLPFVVLGCIFARPLIQFWAGSQYTGAALVMQWLLIAGLSHAIAYSSDQLLYACGEVRRAATITFWSGAASVAGALLLVSRFGAAGLAAGIALAQLLVNCSWFALAACRLAHIAPLKFLRVLFDGLAWPLAVLAAETGIVWSLSSRLSPLSLVIAAFLCGCFYMAIWGFYTALPLYRDQPEIVA
jgi:O-antigen/teichoic acid export membrane protein